MRLQEALPEMTDTFLEVGWAPAWGQQAPGEEACEGAWAWRTQAATRNPAGGRLGARKALASVLLTLSSHPGVLWPGTYGSRDAEFLSWV